MRSMHTFDRRPGPVASSGRLSLAFGVLAALFLLACDGASEPSPSGADTTGGSPAHPVTDAGGSGPDPGGPIGTDSGGTGGGNLDDPGGAVEHEPCEYFTDCGEGLTCRAGSCAPFCPENPCPEDWFCVAATGACIQECLADEECERDGFWCEAQKRCVPGCTWRPCSGGRVCDEESGLCAPSLCDWEVQAGADRLWFEERAADTTFLQNVFVEVRRERPWNATIDLRLGDGSDPEFALGDVARIEGDNAVLVELPYEARPGERLRAQIRFFSESDAGAFATLEVSSPDANICANNPVFLGAPGTATCLVPEPRTLAVGKVAWGDVGRYHLRLRNGCGRAIRVLHARFLAANVDWSIGAGYEGAEIAAGDSLSMEVFFAPTMPTKRPTLLFVVTDDPENRLLEIELTGEGAQED